jgi:glycosyltransferase involved in cell wall biosynthesis
VDQRSSLCPDNNSIKVSILSLNYPPEPSGNAPYSGALARGLQARGYDVTAYTSHPHYPEWQVRDEYGGCHTTETIDGVQVHRLKHYVPNPPRGFKRLISEISYGFRLLWLPWNKTDVVVEVSPAMFANALANLRILGKRRKPAVIVWVKDIYTLGLIETGEGGRLVANVAKRVESRLLQSSDAVVVIHKKFADYVINVLKVPAERVHVLLDWSHLPLRNVLDHETAKKEMGWPEDQIVIIHTGNMGLKQGLENLIDAAKIADEKNIPVLFILIGGGSQRASLEERARGVAHIRFVDSLPDSKYTTALAASDALIVNEKPGVAGMSVPSKMTSYFDAGRPVIAATDPDGITAVQIAAAGAGIVVPAGMPERILDAALELYANPTLAASFGASARRFRETELDEATAIDSFSQIVMDCIEKRAKRIVS